MINRKDSKARQSRIARLKGRIKDEPRDANGNLKRKWADAEAEIKTLEEQEVEGKKVEAEKAAAAKVEADRKAAEEAAAKAAAKK